MKLQTIVMMIITFLGTLILSIGSIIAYGMDWQREQDTRMSGMDKLMERQAAVLEMQININEKIEERRMIRELKPSHSYEEREVEVID